MAVPDGGLLGTAAKDENVCRVQDAGAAENSCHAGLPPIPVAVLRVTPILLVLQPVVLVKKTYTSPARKAIFLGVDDSSFDGTGTFTFSTAHIRFFTDATAGAEIVSGHVFKGAELAAAVTLWAQGATPSDKMDDVALQLALTPGSKPVNPPAKGTMTAVEVTLDLFKTRTAVGKEPEMLKVPEKTGKPGRIVHFQDTGNHHGRALLIVRKAVPAAFTGTLVLTGDNGEVRVFADPQEVAATGETGALGLPLNLPNGPIPATGRRLWVEGAAVSPFVGHAGFHLGVLAVDTDGDFVKMTSVQLSNVRATVVSTPAAHTQGGNAPVDHAVFGAAAAASNYDESFIANGPLVLIENSLPAGKKVTLSVSIFPRVPVFWAVERNKFGATADHADIQKLTGEPKLTPLKTDTLTATIELNAVGSFFIRPFVDIDGGGNNEFYDAKGKRIDREPFIILNLILVRAQGFSNSSKKLSPAPAITTGNGAAVPIAANTGVGVSTSSLPAGSNWTGPTSAAWNKARITLIGGGPQGTWGVDTAATAGQLVFAGWSQCIEASNIFARYIDPGPPVTPHIERYVFALNSPTTVGPPFSLGLFRAAGSAAPGGGLPSVVGAPTAAALPVLDVSPFGANVGTGGDTCVGTETASNPGPPVPPGLATTNLQPGILLTALPAADHALAYGQDWTVEQWDAPGLGAASVPIMFPGNLVEFRFDLDFRTDLVVWTNVTGVSGPTNDAANRLYASVQTDRWTVRFRITFDPPGSATAGTAHVNTPLAFTMKKDADPKRLASAVEGSGEEVRFPIALACYAIDATT